MRAWLIVCVAGCAGSASITAPEPATDAATPPPEAPPPPADGGPDARPGPPRLRWSDPWRDETGARTDGVLVMFDQDILCGTLQGNFIVEGIPGTVACDGPTATFQPDDP